MPSTHLVISSSAAEIATSITFFVVASIFESFAKNKTSLSCRRLRMFQLAVTGLIVALSVIHAALLAYPTVLLTTESDPDVVCALFTILMWLIMLLPLVERKSDAAYPHYGAWAISSVFEAINVLVVFLSHVGDRRVKFWLDGTVVVLRLTLTLVLLASSAAIRHSSTRKEQRTAEETQPLLLDLESSNNNNDNNKDTSGKDTDEETETESDEEEDDNEEWKEDLAKLKQRSWHEYLGSFKIFLPYLRPHTKTEYFCLLVMITCTAISRVLNVITPLSLGWLVNHLNAQDSSSWKALALYLSLYFISSSSGISVIESLAAMKMSMSMRLSMDVFFYNHIMSLDANFHDSKKTATLGRITDRGDAVIDLFQEFFFEFLPTVSDLLISLAVLQWLFGAYLCFIVAVTGVIFAWSNTLSIRRRTGLRRKYTDSWYAVYEHAFETQYNWTTVSHFGRVEHEKNTFREKNRTKMSNEMALTVYSEVTRCTRQLIMTAGFICACLLATKQIIQGHRQVGDFVILVSYWSGVMAPVRSIISTVTSVSERLVDAEKLLLILEKEPKVKESSDATEFEFKGGNVDFENVGFSYDGERTVSDGITFHADAGQTFALVGETGGGKSTLLKLLFRFYDPTQGRILVDGQDLQNVKLGSFRDLIGIVPQNPALFNRTIFENVRYPDNTATEEEVIEACKAACLHDKIMTFSKQYKEKVGEDGTKLSGGECQRLAIARAILKKPKMLLLDEATSAVDSVTENKIQTCLKQLCKGRTTFVIAHRLSTILHADQILVIKGGKLAEMGPHRSLIKRQGPYRELWEAQLNLQAQEPGDMAKENGEDDKNPGVEERKEKKQSMFYNDMSKEELNEAMLHAGVEAEGDGGPRPQSSSSNGSSNSNKQLSSLGNHDVSNHADLEADVSSGDATEVESNIGADEGNFSRR